MLEIIKSIPMKTIIKSITILAVGLFSFVAQAQQDPNFTLYNFNMNIINPSYAGIKETAELNMVYRSQWIGVPNSPKTMSLAYSKGLGKNLGLGISIIHDKVFVLKETDLAVDFSYKVKMDETTHLYFGLKAGGGFVNIDLSDSGAPGNDPLFTENQSFFNPHIGAGMHITNEKFYISFSTPNFLKGDRYEKQGNAPSAAIDNTHFYLGGGYNFRLNPTLVLTPKVMSRFVSGAPASYDLGASLDIDRRFVTGFNYRLDEMYSVYGMFRIVDKLQLGVAYDITHTTANLINDDGSVEFILKYQF